MDANDLMDLIDIVDDIDTIKKDIGESLSRCEGYGTKEKGNDVDHSWSGFKEDLLSSFKRIRPKLNSSDASKMEAHIKSTIA